MAHSLFTTEELLLEYPSIYGLVTPMRLLKLGYTFSLHPDLEVEKGQDLHSFEKKSLHPTYHVVHLDDDFEFLLIKNKGDEGYFYPRYKNADYLICSYTEEEVSSDVIQIFQNHKDITICFELDTPNQKEILNFTQLL